MDLQVCVGCGVYVGAVMSLNLVWNISDITNAFMAILT